jgi:ice-binding like protein
MQHTPAVRNPHRAPLTAALGVAMLAAVVLLQPVAPAAAANPPTVGLGAANAFTIVAGAGVTNSGPSVISADAGVGGNLGASPLPAVTGFPPGTVTPPGVIHAADTEAADAQTANTTAYNDAAARSPDVVFDPIWDLGGQSFVAGVYNDPSSLAITGTVTLNGAGNPDSVFIFQAGSTLVTSASSNVLLTNGAQACNVFWQVGSSATFGATSTFNGTVLAQISASLGDEVTIAGRVFAQTGAVTLINDKINAPACAPSSGVAQAPLFGHVGLTVSLLAFVAGVAFMATRRRTRRGETR